MALTNPRLDRLDFSPGADLAVYPGAGLDCEDDLRRLRFLFRFTFKICLVKEA